MGNLQENVYGAYPVFQLQLCGMDPIASCYRRELSLYGIKKFVNLKTVYV